MSHKHDHHHISRRKFLGQASCAAVGATTLLSTLTNLSSINAATAMNNTLNIGGANGDYKAIVCILMAGGNDSYNMLVPRGPEYAEYRTTRSNVALPENQLIALNKQADSQPGREFGLHPSMPNLANLFNNSTTSARPGEEDANVAFIANIGSMVEGMTKQEYYDGTKTEPLGLFSHADMVMHWQTGFPHQRVAKGWAGKMQDLLYPNDARYEKVGMNITAAGGNVWQSGDTSIPYALRTWDPDTPLARIDGYGDQWDYNMWRTQIIDNMVDRTYADIYKNAYSSTIKTSLEGYQEINAALSNTPLLQTNFTKWGDVPRTVFSNQLESVARIISANEEMNVPRQVFFVEYGGFDLHGSDAQGINGSLADHASHLRGIDQALGDFNAAMKELGLSDCVTTMCMSEFSRTLTSNGNGTDHAWGANIFAMGGAVKGNRIYGTYPSLALNNDLEIGGGVLLPTTSVDEYFAEIALWFGVPSTDLTLLFPNIGNFYSPGPTAPIGFLV